MAIDDGLETLADGNRMNRDGHYFDGQLMKLKEKLQMLMVRNGLNGQRLARLSQVSDSEISRILQGKSRPGLDNAYRIAKSVGVSLDFLADDNLDLDSPMPGDGVSAEERRVLNLAQRIGFPEVITILETIRFLGYEAAMGRLVGVGAKPIIEIDKETPDLRATGTPAVASLPTPARANAAMG